MTLDQSDSDSLHKYGRGRITASIMVSVVKCRIGKLDKDNIANVLMGMQTFSPQKLKKYGECSYSAVYFGILEK